MDSPQGGIFALGTGTRTYGFVMPATQHDAVRPLTRAYYFVPSTDALRRVG